MKVISIVLLSCLLLAGCAGTSLRVNAPYQPTAGQKFTFDIVNKEKMSDQGLTIMRERLKNQLEASGLLAANASESSRTVEITIDNYYMRHGATRATVGVMAGADKILTTIVVKEGKTQGVLSRFTVYSKNPTAWGTSQGMIEEHADKIVDYLKSGRR